MTDERFAAVLADGATRAAALSSAEREQVYAELRQSAIRVGRECGYSLESARVIAEELIAAVREVMVGPDPSPVRVLH